MKIKLISGGQSGVDRAALDFARENGMQCGGWCPKGRRAEDGIIPSKYPLTETSENEYSSRTYMNVQNSDATLILYDGNLSGGTLLTYRFTKKQGKACKLINLEELPKVQKLKLVMKNWLVSGEIKVLNIAGPRESECPGIYHKSKSLLEKVFL